MARKRIVCIEKSPTHHDRHHHIAAVGVGTQADRATERLTTPDVIANIEAPYGDRYFVRGSDGSDAAVTVKSCPVCGPDHKIISTTRDNTKKDRRDGVCQMAFHLEMTYLKRVAILSLDSPMRAAHTFSIPSDPKLFVMCHALQPSIRIEHLWRSSLCLLKSSTSLS